MAKKIIISILGCLIGFSVLADINNVKPTEFSYVFHLYYDKAQLYADRDFQFKYDIVAGSYVQPAVGQFPYRGVIINIAGEPATSFKFDVQSGKISVRAPFVADGQKAVFYDSQNQLVLAVPVSDSSFCNDDGICNTDRGEDSLTCPKDCKGGLPAPAATTTPTASGGGSAGVVSGVIYAVVGLGLAGGLWWFFKKRSSSSQLPPLSLPTPPTPPGPKNTV